MDFNQHQARKFHLAKPILLSVKGHEVIKAIIAKIRTKNILVKLKKDVILKQMQTCAYCGLNVYIYYYGAKLCLRL
jgi:hypothetical protein